MFGGSVLWLLMSAVLAGSFGVCAGLCLAKSIDRKQKQRHKEVLVRPPARDGPSSFSRRLVDYAVSLSTKIELGIQTPFAPSVLVGGTEIWLERKARSQVYKASLTAVGLTEASLQLGLLCAAGGIVVGFLFSNSLALILGFIGLVVGAAAPFKALDHLCLARIAALERNLPEMLETIALGLRSGLSFDRSFQLYGEHFDSLLAQECQMTFRVWTTGLSTREDALRNFAATYNSALFSRVVENVVRSLQFGSSLAEGLESTAATARDSYRATIEERVAKAPVKMMIPTGTLILPSMLLLVLGPVLLELGGGL